jgi:chromosome segregation ATPase
MLIVLSLLTTAAFIVYVNKEDLTKTALTQSKAALDSERLKTESLGQQVSAIQANLTANEQKATAEANASSAENSRLQQEISKLNVDLAKASGTSASQQLDIARLTEALNASQTTSGKMGEEVTRLRTGNVTLVRQSSELNSTVSDLTNKLEMTEKERRKLAEQLTQTSADAQRMGQVIKGAGLSPQQQEVAVNRSGLPQINGVIREVRPIAGQQYATISVGSADGVTAGMEFKVLDRATQNFLGTLTIVSVEPNEATGRLVGPNVAAIRPGVEVRTQL